MSRTFDFWNGLNTSSSQWSMCRLIAFRDLTSLTLVVISCLTLSMKKDNVIEACLNSGKCLITMRTVPWRLETFQKSVEYKIVQNSTFAVGTSQIYLRVVNPAPTIHHTRIYTLLIIWCDIIGWWKDGWLMRRRRYKGTYSSRGSAGPCHNERNNVLRDHRHQLEYYCLGPSRMCTVISHISLPIIVFFHVICSRFHVHHDMFYLFISSFSKSWRVQGHVHGRVVGMNPRD